MRYRHFVALAGLVGLGGCVSPVGMQPHVAPASPAFDPVAFFAGQTHGTGMLHVIASKPRRTDVVGYGTSPGPEAITLDQQVRQGDAAATHRTWHLRRIAPGRYVGTLTDAIGPVTADSAGAELVIRFTMRHGLKVVQHLYLQPGGRIALNTMTVRKWGIVVARLNERIERS